MANVAVNKVVLAYSGGLDTSVIVPWLKNNYGGCEVICFTADLGQEEELDGLEAKALASGASKLIIAVSPISARLMPRARSNHWRHCGTSMLAIPRSRSWRSSVPEVNGQQRRTFAFATTTTWPTSSSN